VQWPALTRIENKIETAFVNASVAKLDDCFICAWISCETVKLTKFVSPNLLKL
jgi:hypothetical protein